MRKKLLAIGFVAALLVSALVPSTALAHSGHGPPPQERAKFEICHQTGSGEVTITVSGNSHTGHAFRHRDTIGPCE